MKRLAVIAVTLAVQGCANYGHMDPEDLTLEKLFGVDEPTKRYPESSSTMYPELYDTSQIKDYSKPNSASSPVRKLTRPHKSKQTSEPTNLDWTFGVAPTYLSNPTTVSAAWYGRFGLMCSKSTDYRKFSFKLNVEQIKRFRLFNPSSKFYGAIALDYGNGVQMRFENPMLDIKHDGVYLEVSSRRYDTKPVKLAMNRTVKAPYMTVILESYDYKKEYRVESNKFLQQKPRDWNCKR